MEIRKVMENVGKTLALGAAAVLALNVMGCSSQAPAAGNASLASCGKAAPTMAACKGMNTCKSNRCNGKVRK